ncbi:MAG: hypothetical protein Q7R69_02070 [bacterium]|nr:hypothetical protein [bacterium]
MQTLTKNKGILAIIAVFIAAMFLYNLFWKSDTTSEPAELSASSIGDDLLKIYDELQAVTLDRAVFSSAGYLLLTDFGVTIPLQTVGRPNPFDIIGRD